MDVREEGMQWYKAMSITGDVLNMASSSLYPIFNVWSTLQQVLAPSAPSSEPSVVPELTELIHEAVYEVYSPPSPLEPELEIVFLHGLQLENGRNAYFKTWMTADNSQLWLKTWLVAEFPRARILTIAYDSAAKRTHEVGRLDMYCTGENLVQLLTGDSVRMGRTGCPIVLVGHCLGGLVLKELCLSGQWLLARNPELQDIRNFMSSLKGMFFYGTPHCGALLGEKLDRERFNSPLLEEMDVLKNSVARSNQAFSEFMTQYRWMTAGVGELHSTFVKCLGQYIHIVPEASTRPYMAEYHSVSGDHYSICKPENKRSTSFLVLCNFLRKVCKEVTIAHGKSRRHKINELHQMIVRTARGKSKKHKRNDSHQMIFRTSHPLPFGPDRNYVPILGSIRAVQKALEDADAPRVVTLHAGPGTGKSSLAKYLALYYQNATKQHMAAASTTVCFPDGVFYLLCGRGAEARIKQLQMELLQSLGGGVGSSTNPNNWSGAPGPGEEFMHLPSHHTKLILRLAEQKVLIVLDDVWEEGVLENLLVPSMGVKYLVTSQMRLIWRGDATIIGLQNPDIVEARRIMANFTEGLPTKGEFPDNITDVTDKIIQRLDYHPLSLANVGIAINRSKAADPREWETVKESIQDELDEDDFYSNPPVYGTRYPLTVGASMMLMVDSLPPGPRRLLFLMGLLEGPKMPEVVVKLFFKLIEPIQPRRKYQRQINYLDHRSLVELHCHRAYGATVNEEDHMSRFDLVTHGLRTYFVRKNHTRDVRCIGTEIVSSVSVSSSDQGGQLIQSGRREETLATIMSAMYFVEPFRDVVMPQIVSQSRIFNAVVIPRSMSYEVDVLDLMNRARFLKRLQLVTSVVWLLNPDGEGGWKQHTHEYVKTIMIRLAFRKELDDGSMAQLIQLPQTTTAACDVLQFMLQFAVSRSYLLDFPFVYHKDRTFSSVHGKTMKSLLCLLDDDTATTGKRAAGIVALGSVLDYESEDTILKVAKKWVEYLAKESNPTLQMAVAGVLRKVDSPSRKTLLVGEFPQVLDRLLILMFDGKNSDVQCETADTIYCLSGSSSIVSRIMTIPGALEYIQDLIYPRDQGVLSGDQQHLPMYYKDRAYYAGKLLSRLSCIPENRIRFTRVHDGIKKLTEMLSSKSWRSETFIHYFITAAEILGNLALTNEVRETILATAPEVEEGLLLLQLSMSSPKTVYATTEELDSINKYIWLGLSAISRVITILGLDTLQANTTMVNPIPPPRACFLMLMGRVRGYMDMGLYSEALAAFRIPDEWISSREVMWYSEETWWCEFHDNFRPLKIFLKAMVKDYAGAMLDAKIVVEEYQNLKKEPGNKELYLPIMTLLAIGDRGVVRQLSGTDLGEALADLDEALANLDKALENLHQRWVYGRSYVRNPHKHQYGLLKHRGLVKHMMGDQVGARADAKSALQLKQDRLAWEETNDALGPRYLVDLPVNYLRFTL